MKLAKGLGVEFAFPSQTVMIEEFPEKKAANMKYETAPEKMDRVLQDVLKDFGAGLK